MRHLTTEDLAEELSGQYQGDIVMTPEQLTAIRGGKIGKTGLTDTSYRWNDKTVPYWIDETYFSKYFHTICCHGDSLHIIFR